MNEKIMIILLCILSIGIIVNMPAFIIIMALAIILISIYKKKTLHIKYKVLLTNVSD